MSDDEIIALIADGNLSAFEQLYQKTYKQIFAFILSMTKCRHTSEDLMHDIYMRVFEKAKSYKSGTNARTWIMTIAKNLTYDYFRKTRNVIPFDECLAENNWVYSSDVSDEVSENMVLEKAIRNLSTTNAQIAVLYAVCGYKHREIASILSIPEGTVRRRYKDAVRQLANEIGGVTDE